MHVLVIGNGGREHAIAWKLAQSEKVIRVSVAPGNAGTATAEGVENIAIPSNDITALRNFALQESVGLTVVGPEDPLVAGIVDAFREAGLAVFGPTAAAAQLEGSKTFSKDFLARHGIPTARYQSFTALPKALAYIEKEGAPIVIKADGLAAGKGVVVAMTVEDAKTAATDMLAGNRFGSAGARVVVESFLKGEEASFICVVDGKTALPLATSQDHKARDEGDTGPNTGGMGAYSPAPVVTPAVHDRIMAEVINPTVEGMAADGHPFTGFLYAGLMIDDQGAPHVIEFNVRCGDPETQPIMARMRSDLVQVIECSLAQQLDQLELDWDPRPALGVVLASGGYPGDYESGMVINGHESESADALVFHAGTAIQGEDIVTSGGRVMCVVGLGDTLQAARDAAYARAGKIDWNDQYLRYDIGHRAL